MQKGLFLERKKGASETCKRYSNNVACNFHQPCNLGMSPNPWVLDQLMGLSMCQVHDKRQTLIMNLNIHKSAVGGILHIKSCVRSPYLSLSLSLSLNEQGQESFSFLGGIFTNINCHPNTLGNSSQCFMLFNICSYKFTFLSSKDVRAISRFCK